MPVGRALSVSTRIQKAMDASSSKRLPAFHTPAPFPLSPFRTQQSLPSSRLRTTAMCHSQLSFSSVQAIDWLPKPIAVSGLVQHGFGRGSRSLGTPTANLPGSLLDNVNNASRDGVYLGFGRVPKFGDAVVKMVASIGYNVTFGDVKQRVLEAHLMSDIFQTDFYGEEMRLCIVAFMRPELKFNSLQQLVEHIRNDISVANQALDLPQAQPYRTHPLLLS